MYVITLRKWILLLKKSTMSELYVPFNLQPFSETEIMKTKFSE